ncbi:MAG: XRE family transcriptional regulator [Chloroflexota bacterium]|nr:XRE family transcriptional regulator [Chloroflexota bacterium]
MDQRTEIGINPTVLKWAREWRGKTVEEAASKVKKKPSDIVNWEQNVGSPTVNQARTLAQFYDRPFLEFFLDAPPQIAIPQLVPDYRMHAGVKPRGDDRDLQFIQQWADTKRTDALDLYVGLGIDPPEIPKPLFTTLDASPERAAALSREAMTFPLHEQIKLTKADARLLPTILRAKLEGLGVLTLRRPDLRQFNARGICLALFPLPVIVVQNEAPTGQAFTLIHEFAHILLGQSGITGERTRESDRKPIEAWCDRFAAAFLMPTEQITAFVGPTPSRPSTKVPDAELERLADIFRVSPHAVLIRLVQLGYVQASYYWDVKKPQFDNDEREFKSFGRARYYSVRYRSEHGDLYTGLVLEAWSSGRITNHHAAEYLGIKNIDHLEDIRADFSTR